MFLLPITVYDGQRVVRSYSQPACGQTLLVPTMSSFVSMGVLNSHVRNIHQKLVKFRCQICGKGYDGRINYHDHMATHAGVKRNVCTICQARFTFKRSLKVHVMRFHPDAIESLSHS